MTFYVTNQNLVVLYLFALGAILGVLYDAFVIKRVLLKTPAPLLFLEDLLFCLISCTAFMFTVFITNYGYVRWYEIIFALSGFAAYKLVFSYFIVRSAVYVLRLIIKAITFIVGLIVKPIKLIFLSLWRFIIKLIARYKAFRYNRNIINYSRRKMKRECELANKGFRI